MFQTVADWSLQRVSLNPTLASGGRRLSQIPKLDQNLLTAQGLGSKEAWRVFEEQIIQSMCPNDHPMDFSYVGSSPTPASVAVDMAISAMATSGGNRGRAAHAIDAENQALRWLADLAGFPAEAGGVFVSGGTSGNLSALHAARWRAAGLREQAGRERPSRWKIALSDNAHSSIAAVARIMDTQLCFTGSDEQGRMLPDSLEELLSSNDGVCAVAATAGATNTGAVDDLDAIAEVCARHKVWLHVDGAYGLAALASPAARGKFAGLERADSFIVDPHKWLFAPYDCCAIIYREPEAAKFAHRQEAPYLGSIDHSHWNPSSYAAHLSRRLRGLPLWFSLVTYGTDRYAKAVDRVLQTSAEVAAGIEAADHLELLMQPDLSVLLFSRPGMDADEVREWCFTKWEEGKIVNLPTMWRDELVFRLCLVHPKTESAEVLQILEELR